MKLQTFLNNFEAFSLAVNGTYDMATYNAVKAFQVKYANFILTPWGATQPTGYVYYTTKKTINEIYCKFQKQFPLTGDQEAEIARIKALGQAYVPSGNFVSPPSPTPAPAGSSAPSGNAGSQTVPPGQGGEVGAVQPETQPAAAGASSAGQQGGGWWSGFWGWLTGH
jgi:hypothetical protein